MTRPKATQSKFVLKLLACYNVCVKHLVKVFLVSSSDFICSIRIWAREFGALRLGSHSPTHSTWSNSVKLEFR